ncbi:MAG: monofunctional biosynthetic peptidoglycan transglycosylase [Alphaproteobacteria bacterium]
MGTGDDDNGAKAEGGSLWRDLVKGLRWLAIGMGALAAITIVWVLVYRFLNPPTTFLMTVTSFRGVKVDHRSVSINRISPALWQAIIGAEDSRFCEHGGFDLEAISDAMEEAENGGRKRGASTITQQTAKNAFLWPGRSYLRKGVEAYFTFLMETLWPKRRIMEVYLNIVEFGPGVFGAEAAAQRYFKKPARDIGPYEAAVLAAVLPNPKRMHADRPSPYVRLRAGTLVARAQVVRNEGFARCVQR